MMLTCQGVIVGTLRSGSDCNQCAEVIALTLRSAALHCCR